MVDSTEPLGILLRGQVQHLEIYVHLYASSVSEIKVSWGTPVTICDCKILIF